MALAKLECGGGGGGGGGGFDELLDSVISSIKSAREAPITLVDNEHESVGSQGVVEGNGHHGVGVAGQFTNNPLSQNTHTFIELFKLKKKIKKKDPPVVLSASLTSGLF